MFPFTVVIKKKLASIQNTNSVIRELSFQPDIFALSEECNLYAPK